MEKENSRLLTDEEVLDNSSGDYGKEEYLSLLGSSNYLFN